MRLLRRNRWPVIDHIHDTRQCPYCAALVHGNHGQRYHEEWHDDLDNEINGEAPAPDPGGYVVGSGPLPATTRGGRYGEDDDDRPGREAYQ